MFRKVRLHIYYVRKKIWRRTRILFPSPAEVRFVQVMGGRVLVFNYVRSTSTHYPLAIFISMGKILRREFVQREVRVGAMHVDFAFITSYGRQAIEIDGRNFHMDVVREQERDEYLNGRGWRVLHIQAVDLWRNPDAVQRRVIRFLAN